MSIRPSCPFEFPAEGEILVEMPDRRLAKCAGCGFC